MGASQPKTDPAPDPGAPDITNPAPLVAEVEEVVAEVVDLAETEIANAKRAYGKYLHPGHGNGEAGFTPPAPTDPTIPAPDVTEKPEVTG